MNYRTGFTKPEHNRRERALARLLVKRDALAAQIQALEHPADLVRLQNIYFEMEREAVNIVANIGKRKPRAAAPQQPAPGVTFAEKGVSDDAVLIAVE